MTYEDLKEEDVNKMRNLNRKNHYCLSCTELESLAKKHQNPVSYTHLTLPTT